MEKNNNLCELLILRNVSYRQLADAIGVSQSSIYRYIYGRIPQVDVALKIAYYLDVDVDDIWEVE